MTTEHLHQRLHQQQSASRHAAVIDAAKREAARLRAEAIADFGTALWQTLRMALSRVLGRGLSAGRAALRRTGSQRRTGTPTCQPRHRAR